MKALACELRFAPGSPALSLGVLLCAALCSCGPDETQRTLPSVQLAITPDVPPIYDDGELTLFEVRRPVQLPILEPTDAQRAALRMESPPPFERHPWVTLSDVRVQLTWTLTNLDDEPRFVEVLIDPWNEFARYFPGLMLVDAQNGEYIPNLSGINYLFRLEGRSQGATSRRHGTFTFDEMDELARDFATVMHLVAAPPPPLEEGEGDWTLVYANHAFSFQNHSTRDPLVLPWLPSVIPALTGFDLGLRTEEPATLAIEVVVEVVDREGDRVQGEGLEGELLDAPDRVITLGSGAL